MFESRRRRGIAAAVIAAICLACPFGATGQSAGPSAPSAPAATPPPAPSVAPSPEVQAASFLDGYWRTHQTPAISVAVARRGKLVFTHAVGYSDLDQMTPATGSTVYNIGSVSKVLAAVAVLQLVQAGKVRLDDPIRRFVPSLPARTGTPITIRHILTHTSGIRHYLASDFPDSADNENVKPVAAFEEGIRVFKNDPLLFEPGRFYSYSSYAVNLLQGVVEKASGQAFEEYMRRSVWEPAGMLASQFDLPERIVPNRARGYRADAGRVKNYYYGDLTYKFAGGGIISTAEDLVRFGVSLLHGRLLDDDMRSQMFRVNMDPVMRFEAGKPPEKQTFRQGLIVRIRTDAAGRLEIDHPGSVKGFGAYFILYPEKDLVIALIANMDSEIGRQETEKIAGFFLDAAD